MLKNADLMRKMFSGMKVPSSIGNSVFLYCSHFHRFCQGYGMKHKLESEQQFKDKGLEHVKGMELKGIGCSAGIISGKACVITNLDEAPKMNKGDVLVTKYTDPSWCPLFSLASAVVLVDGGVLSHAAVVAREMKIPCVMQIKDALSLDNQQIIVDGSNGLVKIVE